MLLLELSCLGDSGISVLGLDGLGWPGPHTPGCGGLVSPLGPFPSGQGQFGLCPGHGLLSFPSPWSRVGHTIKAAGSACPPVHHSPSQPCSALSPLSPWLPLQQRCMNVPPAPQGPGAATNTRCVFHLLLHILQRRCGKGLFDCQVNN